MSDIKPEDYSCEILLEKTTPEKAKDSSFPTDAYNVTYTVDGEDRLDVCRAQKAANIFDLYYDKYKNVKRYSVWIRNYFTKSFRSQTTTKEKR